MNNIRFCKLKVRRNGFTLVELLIVLFLSVVVLAVSARLFLASDSITSLADYFVSQETQTRYTAERINNAIKYTNALFTIPRSSFNYSNLTESWSYLGMMDDVYIPYKLIKLRNGDDTAKKYGEGTFTRALVYIKYLGSQKETDEDYISPDVLAKYNLLKLPDEFDEVDEINAFYKEPYEQYIYTRNTDDGYFLVTIIDYELYDERLGYETKYELVFDTTNDHSSGDIISGSIQYSLKVTYVDRGGEVIGVGSNIELETMLNGINLLQAVYQGSKYDPATAIAFHEDGFKVDSAPMLNIVFVLDLSGSMYDYMQSEGTATRRIQALAKNVQTFINSFQYDSVYVSFVEFSTSGKVAIAPVKATASNVKTYTTNLFNRKPEGGTNLGDGFRVAYKQFDDIVKLNPGAANVIIKISDGFTNGWSIIDPVDIVSKINTFNANVNSSKKGQTIGNEYKYKYVAPSEVGGITKYYWDPYNLPNVILYLDGTTRYVFYQNSNKTAYLSWNFNFNSDSYSSKNNVTYSGDTITYKPDKDKNVLTYTRPTIDQLRGKNLTGKYDGSMTNFTIAKDYAAFTLGKIFELSQTHPDYKIAAFYDIYVNAKDVEADESGMIADALQIGKSNTEYFTYTVDNTRQFSECIGTLVSNINTASWLLNGPRV